MDIKVGAISPFFFRFFSLGLISFFITTELNGQLINVSANLGMSSPVESSKILQETAPFYEPGVFNITSSWALRFRWRFKKIHVSLGVNNASRGNSYAIDIKKYPLTAASRYRRTTGVYGNYFQFPIQIGVLNDKALSFRKSDFNRIRCTLLAGLTFSKTDYSIYDLEGGIAIGNSTTGAEDSILITKKIIFYDKLGIGLMSELEINYFKKNGNYPFPIFLKIVFHQGLTILGESDDSYSIREFSGRLHTITRGSYFSFMVGFNIFNAKRNYFKSGIVIY